MYIRNIKSHQAFRLHFIILALSLALITSCTGNPLEEALEKAGENRASLESVLEHYKGDTLKYKAARFLISNMDGHYSYGGAAVDSYYVYMDSLFNHFAGNQNFWAGKYESAFKRFGRQLEECSRHRVYDISSIEADYLIKNIDRAFEVWQRNWNKQYSFDMFCQYVLPYRIGHEKLSCWRDTMAMPEEMQNDYDRHEDNTTYCYGLVDNLVNEGRNNLYYPSRFIPDFPLTMLPNLQAGPCREFSAKCVALLRAYGLAAAIDFTPQWGNRSMGHDWAVFFPTDHIAIPNNIKERFGSHFTRRQEDHLTKVYRRTYAKNSESLFFRKKKDEQIPEWLDTPYIKDVTGEYTQTSDVTVKLPSAAIKDAHLYLAAFDNSGWNIVAWGERKGRRCTFPDMARSVVYLPVVYRNGQILTAGTPFLLDKDGNVHPFNPDCDNTISMTVKRKYREGSTTKWLKAIIGGTFQVSDTEDFETAEQIAEIGTYTDNKPHTLIPHYEGKHTCFRYVAPDNSGGQMAEITLYDEKGDTIVPQRIIGNVHVHSGCKPQNLYDSNPLTYYFSHEKKGVWTGIVWDKPVHISKITVLPRNDDNFISEGNLYELFYWGEGKWTSLGRQDGNLEGSLTFHRAPRNALFLLRNHTKGKEERIFTYDGNKQIWW